MVHERSIQNIIYAQHRSELHLAYQVAERYSSCIIQTRIEVNNLSLYRALGPRVWVVVPDEGGQGH